ncbi:hypothetical protein NEFER03_0983 [Nematocida sp. LUAm3]|nr:hypothetical protein NEFER03_0983 [Nematocida sp. LUAm3]KAI5175413.1 hypothetical protein NEFER02_1342 [Nematocida sp. LUAm2]KAI5177630.1 hypothetical protein NEFER01_0854 [Nematocida sp. LUAm1]
MKIYINRYAMRMEINKIVEKHIIISLGYTMLVSVLLLFYRFTVHTKNSHIEGTYMFITNTLEELFILYMLISQDLNYLYALVAFCFFHMVFTSVYIVYLQDIGLSISFGISLVRLIHLLLIKWKLRSAKFIYRIDSHDPFVWPETYILLAFKKILCMHYLTYYLLNIYRQVEKERKSMQVGNMHVFVHILAVILFFLIEVPALGNKWLQIFMDLGWLCFIFFVHAYKIKILGIKISDISDKVFFHVMEHILAVCILFVLILFCIHIKHRISIEQVKHIKTRGRRKVYME